jgi:hypothetical protein
MDKENNPLDNPTTIVNLVGVVYKLVPSVDLIYINYLDMLRSNEYYQQFIEMYPDSVILGMEVYFRTLKPIGSQMPLFVMDGMVAKPHCISVGTFIDDSHKTMYYVGQPPAGVLTIANVGALDGDKWLVVFSFRVRIGNMNNQVYNQLLTEYKQMELREIVVDASNFDLYNNKTLMKPQNTTLGKVHLRGTQRYAKYKNVLPFILPTAGINIKNEPELSILISQLKEKDILKDKNSISDNTKRKFKKASNNLKENRNLINKSIITTSRIKNSDTESDSDSNNNTVISNVLKKRQDSFVEDSD